MKSFLIVRFYLLLNETVPVSYTDYRPMYHRPSAC